MIIDFFIPILAHFCSSGFWSYVIIPILCLSFIAIVPFLIKYIVGIRR